MRNRRPATVALAQFLLMAALVVPMSGGASGERASLDELLAAIVGVKTFINPDGRTVENLGRDREGSGIVIDENGLVLTIGYLMLEAHAAEVKTSTGHTFPASVVGYDYDSGLGLLRSNEPLKLPPMSLGKSSELKERDAVLVASFGGASMVAPAHVVAIREFAGSWEYLLDNAIFTAPPHPEWSGAALINRAGRLVGVGSLIVGDATGADTPGNMFVPIDRLPPVLGDLIANGHPSGAPHPWLGLTTSEARGRLIINRVTPEGPAEKAGLQRGDIIVGIASEKPASLADFYRKVWAQGSAGCVVALDVLRDDEIRRFDVRTMNRLDYLKLKSTF